jgi:DNA topoisomerase-1
MDDFAQERFNLLIVESPTKATTINKYLKDDDEDWIVKSTRGHIKNLPPKKFGLTYEGDEVKGDWEWISKDTQVLMTELKQLAKNAESVFIATDDDREGERIASDVADFLQVENHTRVVFAEITQKAIQQELYSSARDLDEGIIEAAKANRFIDRELGYGISTILRKDQGKILKDKDASLAVGRVISPALSLISERERQIANFEPEKYNQVSIDYVYNGRSFRVHNPLKFKLEDELHLNRFISKLQTSKHVVTKYDDKIEDITPHKPLHTSSMQYSAWYVLEIMPEDTMKYAQKLFELGLITYHRTDSVRVSKQAVKNIRNVIAVTFDDIYLSPSPRTYSNGKKKVSKDGKEGKQDAEDNIQDAHEAIRPTQYTPKHFPENVRKSFRLEEEELKLYNLIWARTLITQMSDARYDRSRIVITIADEEFSARANDMVFEGWEIISKKVLNISNLKKENSWQDERVVIPRIGIDVELYPLEIMDSEHTTRRPNRYGVGTFISSVHTMAFARPSTIGTLIKNLSSKKYVEIQKGILFPTKLGMSVDEWTSKHFSWLNDTKHAKIFEDELQKIENGEIEFGNSLVIEYHKLVEEGAKNLGIDITFLSSNAPSEAQIRKIKNLAKKLNIVVGDEVLNDKDKANVFITKYAKVTRIKSCPYCKKGDISEHDDYFKCDNNSCNFIVTKKRMFGYFERFKVEVEEYELVDIVKDLTLKKGYFAKDLVKKDGGKFSTNLVFEHSEEYGWSIGFRKKISRAK